MLSTTPVTIYYFIVHYCYSCPDFTAFNGIVIFLSRVLIYFGVAPCNDQTWYCYPSEKYWIFPLISIPKEAPLSMVLNWYLAKKTYVYILLRKTPQRIRRPAFSIVVLIFFFCKKSDDVIISSTI